MVRDLIVLQTVQQREELRCGIKIRWRERLYKRLTIFVSFSGIFDEFSLIKEGIAKIRTFQGAERRDRKSEENEPLETSHICQR